MTRQARLLTALVAAFLVASPLLERPAQAETRVPAGIDPTGRSDVTAELQHFVDSVPDGETIAFPAGARYRIDGTLEWRDRTGLTLEGGGARLVAGTHGGPNRAHVRLIDGADWTIRDLTIEGAKPARDGFRPALQWQHGVDLRGVQGATIERVTVRDVFGDDIYVGRSTSSTRWSRNIAITDCIGERSGRMGVAITAGRRVTVSGGVWSDPGLSTFDVEPNGGSDGANRILIEHTTIGRGSRGRVLDIAGRGAVANVTLRMNKLTGRPLHVLVDQGNERPRNIAVVGNDSAVPFVGPPPAALIFRNTDGVTVTRNTQPIPLRTPLPLVAVSGSGGVEVDAPLTSLASSRVAPSTSAVLAIVAGAMALVAVLSFRRLASR
jgi:hypothetical protein